MDGIPDADYQVQWFDPRTGLWLDIASVTSVDRTEGILTLPLFPGEE